MTKCEFHLKCNDIVTVVYTFCTAPNARIIILKFVTQLKTKSCHFDCSFFPCGGTVSVTATS